MASEDFSYVTRVLQKALENGSTPGIALLVDINGERVYQEALGYAQIYPERRELQVDTIFDIASLTKVVATTTAMMLLLRDKKCSLDDSVKKYISEFPHEQITFTHLLTHSAGFPDHIPFFEAVQQEADRRDAEDFVGSTEAKEFVLSQVCQTELVYAPGRYSKYSDLGFMLLGDAIENISGTTLDQYCDEMIFRPLNMSTTFFQKRGKALHAGTYAATERCEWRRREICGEVHDENAYAMGGVAGHAGLFSTLDDIHRFMTMLQRSYNGDDDIIPTTIVRKFFSRQSPVADSTWALGWDTPSKKHSTSGTLLSEKSVGHTGFTGTSIWFDLNRKLLILLFSNRIHPSRLNQTFLKMRPKIHDAVVIAIDRNA